MDAKEAADAARKHLTDALPHLDSDQISLEEVVPGLARRDWCVSFSFPSLEAHQGQQSAIAKRSYKDLIISDADGSLICITACTPCSPKSCKIPCTAGQRAQPGCVAPTPMSQRGRVRSLWDGLRSLWRVIFVYANGAAGFGSLITLYIKAGFGDPKLVESWLPLLAAVVWGTVGFFVVGRQLLRGGPQPCGNKKKKRCTC